MKDVKAAVGLVEVCSIYVAAGLSVGGALAACAYFMQYRHWWSMIIVGIFIPVFPLYWYFTRPSTIEQNLRHCKAMHDAGLIDEEQYKKYSQALLGFATRKRFPETESKQSPRKSKSAGRRRGG